MHHTNRNKYIRFGAMHTSERSRSELSKKYLVAKIAHPSAKKIEKCEPLYLAFCSVGASVEILKISRKFFRNFFWKFIFSIKKLIFFKNIFCTDNNINVDSCHQIILQNIRVPKSCVLFGRGRGYSLQTLYVTVTSFSHFMHGVDVISEFFLMTTAFDKM